LPAQPNPGAGERRDGRWRDAVRACGGLEYWTGGGGEEEDRGRRGDEETRRRGLHVLLLTGDEGESEATHQWWRRQGLTEERGEEVRRR
jgi:hypothetical protein